MEAELPPELFEAREALWTEIQTAFAGVDRRNGMSWSDAVCEYEGCTIDWYLRACHYDVEEDWQVLIDNPPWDPLDPAVWGLLDPIGFRFYLPVAMARCLQRGEDEDIIGHLAVSGKGDLRMAAFTSPQRRCIDRFLRLMILLSEHTIRAKGLEEWLEWTEIERAKENILQALSYWAFEEN